MASANWYGNAGVHLASAKLDWTADPIYVALLASTYVVDQDAHDFFNDVSANEIVGTGYAAGGVALANKTRTYDAATNRVILDADDTVFTTVTLALLQYAVIYKKRGGASSADELLGYHNLSVQSVTAANFTITWDATGVLRMVAS